MFLITRHHFLLLLTLTIQYTKQEATILCKQVPELSILPGLGIDPLTGKYTNRILKMTYNQCKLTDNGNNLIPDNVEIEKLNTTEITAMVIKNWLNYTSLTTKFQETDKSYYSFSEEYQEMKSLQIKHRAFTCRSQLSRTNYRLNLLSDSITTTLETRFSHIVHAIQRNQTKKAKYLIQMIIRDYGTHYTTCVDVGNMFIKQDYLRNDFLLRRVNQEELITESKLSLLETVRLIRGDEHDLESSLLSEYNDAIVQTKLTQAFIVERSVSVLTNLITTTNFPDAPTLVRIKIRDMLDESIKTYFR
uniref:MACPF domain-containing protein n=1 Tax=Strigamia maritima TaxID=126957 RepID=T1JAM3_STRMM